MKIDYKPPGGAGGWLAFFDEATGGVLPRWRPRGVLGSKQNEPLATVPGQVNSSFKQPLGNVTESIPLEGMAITYASRQASLAASRTFKQAFLTSKNHLRVTEGSEVQYFPNAVCSMCEPDVQGATVVFAMSFEADLVTLTEPS